MIITLYNKFIFSFASKRLVKNNEVAPAPIDRGPEGMQGVEKQREAAMVNEVISKTPSEIVATAVSGMRRTGAKYQNNTYILANLVQMTGNSGSSTATTTATSGTNPTNTIIDTQSTNSQNEKTYE